MQASKADDADDFDVPDEPRDMEVDGDALEGEEEDDDGFIVGAKVRGARGMAVGGANVRERAARPWPRDADLDACHGPAAQGAIVCSVRV